MTRTQNLTGTETCDRCEDGVAVVSRRRVGTVAVAEYGPCPWCEVGYQTEFPEKRRPVWGRAGYWRGRNPETEPLPAYGDELPRAENLLRFRLLIARFGGFPADPCVAIDIKDPKRRIELLERAVAKVPVAE